MRKRRKNSLWRRKSARQNMVSAGEGVRRLLSSIGWPFKRQSNGPGRGRGQISWEEEDEGSEAWEEEEEAGSDTEEEEQHTEEEGNQAECG